MKRIVLLSVMFFLALILVNAQTKSGDKAILKNAKTQAKKYAKEGWIVDGKQPLEDAFYQFGLELEKEGNRELIGMVEGSKAMRTVSMARQWATNNACVFYSKESGMSLRGRIAQEIGEGEDTTALDYFYAQYVSMVQQEIRGELRMSFGIYKENQDGSIDYQAFFIVNENEASKARLRVLENMANESEFASQYAEKISKFINEESNNQVNK